ncbi:sialidase family protein [Streptomyces roseifaciens]|uniref:sialidase family protein n=1 Tax=Streptomyces roseifaciens TaxID=1488406 RepID=UPI0007183100|nr:sialidase family protein [Streptomyces roseifaciens]
MAPPHVRTGPAVPRRPVRAVLQRPVKVVPRHPVRDTIVAAALAGSFLLLPPVAAQQARATGTPSAGFTGASPAAFEEQVLFKAGQEADDGVYACFRIPALATTARGTVLAFAEGRKGDCSDATDIDVVVKRSADGGRTWSPLQVVDEGRGDTHGNPAPVVDAHSSRITLLTTYNKGRPGGGNCDVPCDRIPHLQYSDDDGAHWSAPQDVARDLRPPGWNSWYATGPGHGLRLTRGPHRGRLVVGLNAESHDGTRVRANHAALALSDDGGVHWRLGAVDTHEITPEGTYGQKPSELTLAERADGSVYAGGREQDGTELGNRDFAVSPDGGTGFDGPFRAVPDLYTPMVQGSVAVPRPGRWLFASPADPDRRRSMTIRSSYDEGRTWEGVEHGRLVTADWAGYSDMAVVEGASEEPGAESSDAEGSGTERSGTERSAAERAAADGGADAGSADAGPADAGGVTTGLLYEAGKRDARDEIRFARFTEEWLGPRPAPSPVTPDRAPGARGALVLGGPRPVAGRSGGGLARDGALAFDGVDDAVRLPYRPSLPLGERDFTAALWFRSRSAAAAARGEQPLLWMGGMGGAPQVALRLAPGGRVTGQVTAVAGAGPARTVVVRSAGAYGDGLWHQAVLRRGGGRIVLTVDGAAATAAGVPGAVSRNSTFGVHLGQRPDGREHLTGELDDVRVYGRALTDREVARLRGGGRPGPGAGSGTGPGRRPGSPRDVVLWLPLDRVG